MSDSDGVVYLDSSALVKLFVTEAGTEQLRRHLARPDAPRRLVSSELSLVEVLRGVIRAAGDVVAAEAQLDEIGLQPIDRQVLGVAASLGPPELRTLDAIHVASAMEFGDELTEIITYDRRMQAAATAVGVRWAAPGQSRIEADAPPA
jgi:predicted nucleic acid-binding protein